MSDDTDDDDLWAAYTKGMRPLGQRAPRLSKKSPRIMLRPRDEVFDLPPLHLDAPWPVTAPDRQSKRKIRRGVWEVAAEIDLHGMTQIQAQTALLRFIQTAIMRRHKCVRVITGKSGVGILRQKLPQWLQESPIRDYIVSLHHPPPQQGGTGAWIVILRTAS
jgi:DNA-nicking Smr family endonuclease